MKPQHQVFIIKMIKYGDKVQAYRAAYPKCTNDETARKSAERILRHHPEVAAEIEEATAYMRQRTYAEAYREHVERQKTPLLSMMKRREILAQIATCQMKVGRFVKDGGRYIMLFEDPRPRDIMQAIQTDAKMEDACNRMRNCNDPFFSQFYIYIDGRPCDQPHLPPDPNLPPGIYMLPRRRKNQIEKSGIISEQKQETPLPGGVGVGLLAPDKNQIENPGIISEQNTTQHCPPLGGDRGALAQNQNPGIKTEHYHTEHIHHTSPHPGDLGVLLSPGKIQTENSGIKTEQNKEAPLLFLGGENGEMPTGMSHSGVVDEDSTSAEPHPDPLAASFYKQEQQARASAPPPHILTPDEVKELDEEYARKRRDEKPVKPSTFGKMYFKEKGIDYDNLE